MTRSLVAGLVLAGCALVSSPPSAQAQFGGLIKKTVADKLKKKPADSVQAPSAQAAASQNNPAASFGSAVLEITQGNFDATLNGLTAEIKLQDEFRQTLAKYPTNEQYAACKQHVPESPEGKKLTAEYTNAMQDPKPTEMQRRMMAVATKLEALEKTQCPNDPNTWNSSRKMERLDSIRVQAAAATGGNTTSYQYSILIERIARGCALQAAGGAGSTVGKDSTVMVQGAGPKMFWVWTRGEMRMFNAANCRKFADLTKRLMA